MVTTPASVRRSEPAYTFDFCGGHAAIDFTNTVGSRGGDRRNICAPSATSSHGPRRAGLSDASMRASCAGARCDSPRRRAQRLQRRLHCARRCIARSGPQRHGSSRRHPTSPSSTAICAAHSHTSGSHPSQAASPSPAIRRDRSLIRSSRPWCAPQRNLLTSDALHRVRACADPSCAWLFLDTTRSGTRRWCTMQSCGNRSKVRRFREQR